MGVKLAEISADCSRTWKLSDYGRCQFTIPTRDAKCTLENLQFGNFIYVDHEKLPAWGGVIDTPREWGQNIVTVTGYSGEYIYKWRRIEAIEKLIRTPGKIFSLIINRANRQGNTRIKKGDVDESGETITQELNLLNCYDEIIRLSEEAGCEWMVMPEQQRGSIEFSANFRKQFDIDQTMRNFMLKEGHNIEANDTIMVEQGDIANDVQAIGQGASGESKPTHIATDDESIGKYGLRQHSESFQQDEYSTIWKAARSTLNKMKEPQKTFSLSALDVGDTWQFMILGNVLRLQMSNVGFTSEGLGLETKVRIIGMTYLEDSGKLDLVAEET